LCAKLSIPRSRRYIPAQPASIIIITTWAPKQSSVGFAATAAVASFHFFRPATTSGVLRLASAAPGGLVLLPTAASAAADVAAGVCYLDFNRVGFLKITLVAVCCSLRARAATRNQKTQKSATNGNGN